MWRLGLVGLILLGGCSMAADPAQVSLDGCWSEGFTIPGSGLSLQLVQAESAIGGTGHFSIEAGPSGNLTVTGARSGADFSLTLTYDIGLLRPLSATIRSDNRFDAYPLDASGHRAATHSEFHRCA